MSSLWENLDALNNAEAMDPEDDLILRMQAISKVSHSSSSSKDAKEKKKQAAFKPMNSICKKSRSPQKKPSRGDAMVISSVGASSSKSRPSQLASRVAAAAMAEQPTIKGIAMRRSASI